MRPIRSVAVIALALWAAACSGQADPLAHAGLTVDPRLVRGAPAAPVTIVEFSDYE